MDPVIQAAIDAAVQSVRSELLAARTQAVAAMSGEIQSIRGEVASLRNEMTAGLANLASADMRFGQTVTGIVNEFGAYNRTLQEAFDKYEDLEARVAPLEGKSEVGGGSSN